MLAQELKDKEILFIRLQDYEKLLDECKQKDTANASPGFFQRFFSKSNKSKEPNKEEKKQPDNEVKDDLLSEDILKQIQQQFG